MYMAKEQGKNCYEEYRDQMHTAIVERLELEADLRRTTTGQELVVHYQPIVDLRVGRRRRIRGAGALAAPAPGPAAARARSCPSPRRSG